MAQSRKRFEGILFILSGLIGIWIASQVHQMSQRSVRLIPPSHDERMVVSSLVEVKDSMPKLPVCVPVLPVELWNRDSTEVPNPPRWRRRFV